jgi:hypothetical protein
MEISPYVIEFEVHPKDVKAFLEDPKPLQPAPRAVSSIGPTGAPSGEMPR